MKYETCQTVFSPDPVQNDLLLKKRLSKFQNVLLGQH